jgi:hypothetical protein
MASMLFMLESLTRPGVSRQDVVRFLGQRIKPAAWDLIRTGVASNVYYKTGTDPGFFALLEAPGLAEAEALARGSVEFEGLFDIRIVPVDRFAHFD